WSFASELMTGGAGIVLAGSGGTAASRAGFPQFLSAMGSSRAQRALRDRGAAKVGATMHVSRAKARQVFQPLFEALLDPRGTRLAVSGAPKRRAALRNLIGATGPEMAFLMGVEETDPSVPLEEDEPDRSETAIA